MAVPKNLRHDDGRTFARPPVFRYGLLTERPEPTVANDGQLWTDGVTLWVSDGAAWQEVLAGGGLTVGTTAGTVAAGDDARIAGAAQKDQNLSDLANAATARTNLGVYFTMEFACQSSTPLDAATYYFGFPYDVSMVNLTAVRRQKVIPVACTLRAAAVTVIATAGASNEPSTFYARINDTTDVTLSSAVTMDAALQTFSVTGLSQAIAAGDRVEIKVVTPTWATNPLTVRASVTLFFG